MRKLIVLFLGFMLLALPRAEASISNMTAQWGVYNSTDTTYGLEVDNNNSFHFSATGSSIYYPGTTGSTNQTLTANQSGQIIVFNNGAGVATNGTQFTLPTAVVGMQYSVIGDVAKWFYIKPASTDTINFNSAAQGQRISNVSTAAAGDSVVLVCYTANKWSLLDHVGTWAAASN